MFKIEMDINPSLKQVKKFVEGIEREAIKDLKEFWDRWASPLVAEEMARIFATEGYGRWPPLSPKYAMWKQRHHPGRKMMRLKDLYFTAATRKKAPGNLYVSDKNDMTWGIDLGWFASAAGFPYPAVHEAQSRGKSTSPRRAVFETAVQSRELQNRMVVAFKDYLQKQVIKETRRHFR